MPKIIIYIPHLYNFNSLYGFFPPFFGRVFENKVFFWIMHTRLSQRYHLFLIIPCNKILSFSVRLHLLCMFSLLFCIVIPNISFYLFALSTSKIFFHFVNLHLHCSYRSFCLWLSTLFLIRLLIVFRCKINLSFRF